MTAHLQDPEIRQRAIATRKARSEKKSQLNKLTKRQLKLQDTIRKAQRDLNDTNREIDILLGRIVAPSSTIKYLPRAMPTGKTLNRLKFIEMMKKNPDGVTAMNLSISTGLTEPQVLATLAINSDAFLKVNDKWFLAPSHQ